MIAETGPFERITFEPGKMGGRACIRGLRITVGTIVGLVAEGETTEAILAAVPDLEPEDSRQARACNGLVVAWPAPVNIAGTLPDQTTAGTAQPAEKFAEIPEIRPPGPKCPHFLYRPQDTSTSLPLPALPTSSPLPPFGPPLPTTRPSPRCRRFPGMESQGRMDHPKVSLTIKRLLSG